jgi:hypothetical protein
MYVLVSADSGVRATVKDTHNLKQLHVEFRDVPDEAGAQALSRAGLGSVDREHAWLDVSALRAAGDGGADWGGEFDAMLAYAASKGWTDPDQSRVRAHIVRTLPVATG